jgi:hypothetical protein
MSRTYEIARLDRVERAIIALRSLKTILYTPATATVITETSPLLVTLLGSGIDVALLERAGAAWSSGQTRAVS